MSSYRIEKDSMGDVEVPHSAYYGSQTERSRLNFNIAVETDKMPELLIKSLIILKLSAAQANLKLGCLDENIFKAIVDSSEEILLNFDKYSKEFPLVIWQTGSGTQSNMNVNEVIANVANEKLGIKLGSKDPVHPNDHVNMSQSSNDTFPTAMHLAVIISINRCLLPALTKLRSALHSKQIEFQDVIKVGRTHMQDAVPMTVGQELSSYIYQLDDSTTHLTRLVKEIGSTLAIGGTAVGTGLNTRIGFDVETCKHLQDNLCRFLSVDAKLNPHANKFASLSCHDQLMRMSSELSILASCVLHRLAGDLRLLSSGPRCGLGEYILPSNEPGSSIMPGKVNPTQCEAITQCCVQVMGNHCAVGLGCITQCQLQLNVYKPLIASNVLHSIQLLADSSTSFTNNCVAGLSINPNQINKYLQNNLMIATALNPHIGYDQAANVAKYASTHSLSLKQAAQQMNIASAEELDIWLDNSQMLKPQK